MRVGIFGGRFDPIHNGHLAVAEEVLKMGVVDEVWLSIENQHQWRPIVASTQDRKAMVELAAKEEKILKQVQDDKLKVDMTPVELGGSTATIFVVRELRKKYPKHEFVFIVGSDNMSVFYKWTHWEELLKEVHFLVVARKGSPLDNVPQNASIIEDSSYEPLEDSATRIRELLRHGKSIHGLVPQSVEEYIKEHALYV